MNTTRQHWSTTTSATAGVAAASALSKYAKEQSDTSDQSAAPSGPDTLAMTDTGTPDVDLRDDVKLGVGHDDLMSASPRSEDCPTAGSRRIVDTCRSTAEVEQSSVVWRVAARSPSALTLALMTCDGAQEVQPHHR